MSNSLIRDTLFAIVILTSLGFMASGQMTATIKNFHPETTHFQKVED